MIIGIGMVLVISVFISGSYLVYLKFRPKIISNYERYRQRYLENGDLEDLRKMTDNQEE